MMIVLLVLTIMCAVLAIHASRIMTATLWLACVSALTAVMFYRIGAWTVAIVELSVGTGLVTVLIVFAITMVGDEAESATTARLPLVIVLVALVLIITLTVPFITPEQPAGDPSLTIMLWENRELDMLVQVALLFAGVLGVLGLLRKASITRTATQQKPENKIVPLPQRRQAIKEREAV